MARVIAGDGWTIRPGETVDGENHWDSLFLRHTDDVTLLPGETLTVLLHGVAARVGGAAHHARVVLTYELSTTKETGDATLRGSRALRLYVEPWSENSAELHLHAGVYGGADVLNVGEVSNRIELRVTATAVDGGVGLVAGVTRVELAWDVGPSDSHWWALCTGAQAQAVDVGVQWEEGEEATTDSTTDAVWLTETGAVWSATVQEDRVLAYGDGALRPHAVGRDLRPAAHVVGAHPVPPSLDRALILRVRSYSDSLLGLYVVLAYKSRR